MLNGHTHRLIYETPSVEWIEGLPLGNGTIGAMLFGTPGSEVIALNHDRLWRNKISKNVNIADIIPQVRELCLKGNKQKAEEIILEASKDGPNEVNSFQPFADLIIQIDGVEECSSYYRMLDMQEGCAEISFVSGDITYKYECFISEVNNALFLKISSDKPGTLNCRFEISRAVDPECSTIKYNDKNLLVMEGKFIEGVVFTATADAVLKGGNRQTYDDHIIINNADEIILTLALSTSFNSTDPFEKCRETLENVRQSYEQIKKNHVINHRKYYDRFSFSLGGSDNSNTTEKNFEQMFDSQNVNNVIYEQLLQMARYLVINSSRPGTMPLNLQGIWNDRITPNWDCSYTMDMNIQMHYWLTMPCNLFECQYPVFDWINNGLDILRKQTRSIFGCDGVTIPQYTDFKFSPAKGFFGAFQLIWSGAAAWMAQHFYEYWRYSGDDGFLIEYAYPYMKECAAFYKDFLVKDEKGRYYVCPSCSPENQTIDRSWLVNTATMDITLINEIMGNLVGISVKYGLDEEYREIWQDIKDNLIPYPVDENGILREWVEDVEDLDPYHRHISHIYGIFPGKIFDPEISPDLYDAAVKAIYKRREGGFGSCTSWSHAWYACCFARIGNGDESLKCIDDIVKCCMMNNFLTTHEDCRGLGLTSNHFDYKIFQADAILGAGAAIAEMLIQSYDSGIQILPSLPSKWLNGKVNGLRAYDGYELDVEWMNGKIEQTIVKSHNGGICRLKLCISYPVANIRCKGALVEFLENEKGVITFSTTKGEIYTLF